MKWLIFFILLIIAKTIGCNKATNFTDKLKQQIQSNILNDKNQSFSFNNNTIEGSIPQLYDSALADSPELLAHQNLDAGEDGILLMDIDRVFKCSDHPQVSRSVCVQSKDPCFCAEHESYTYSFCRRSCGYCSEEETAPREFWRVRAIISNPKPLMIKSLLFYHNALDKDAVTTEHILSQYKGQSEKDHLKNRMIFSNGWFENKANRFNAKNDTYVGYKFGYPIVVNAIKAKFGKQNKHTIFVVEAASDLNGPFMKRWIFRTFKYKSSSNVYYKRNCPVLWKKFETTYKTFCFRLVANFTTWNDAKQQCKEVDGELASIIDDEENDFVKEQVRPCGKAWIGYNDIENEGKYVWSDNETSPYNYENWDKKSKNSVEQEKSEDCAAIDHAGVWSTDLCTNSHYYLCKKPVDEILDIHYDTESINIDAPQIVFADDFSKPLLNTTETNLRKLKEDAFFDIRLSSYLPHEQIPG